MNSKQASIWAIAIGSIVLSYSACSPFHGKNMENYTLSTNSDLGSSNPVNQENSSNNQNGNSPEVTPTPSPAQNPTPMPSPNPSTTKMNCANRPSGAVTVLDTAFNTTDGEGQLWEVYPGAGKIMQPSGSNGNASASVLPAGQGLGGQQTIWPKPGNEQPLNNLYLCMRWKMNKDFVGLRMNNKLVFLAAQDFTFGKVGVNGLLSVPARGEAYPLQPSFQMVFGHNTGGLNNSHACAFGLGETCYPNIKDTPIYTDTWYTVEAYVISSTCMTCRNGTVKWWIDGVLQGNYTNLNYGDGIINQWQINHAWDGSPGLQCGPPSNPSNAIGRDCRKDQIHYFDHVVLASVGGRAPASK